MVCTLGLEGLNGCCCVGLLSAGLPSDLSGKPATCWAIDFHWAGLCDPCYVSEQSHQHQPNSHSKECILSSTMLGIACTHGHKQPCMDHRICHQVCLFLADHQGMHALLHAVSKRSPCSSQNAMPLFLGEVCFFFPSLSMQALSSADISAEVWLDVPYLLVHHPACAVALLCGAPHLWARSGV